MKDAIPRLLLLFRGMETVMRGQRTIKVPLLTWRGKSTFLAGTAREAFKGKLLEILDDLDTFSDRAIALGGTVDEPTHTAVLHSPGEALNYVQQRLQRFSALDQSTDVSQTEEGFELVVSPETEQEMADTFATAGDVIKMWVRWQRPQVEAL